MPVYPLENAAAIDDLNLELLRPNIYSLEHHKLHTFPEKTKFAIRHLAVNWIEGGVYLYGPERIIKRTECCFVSHQDNKTMVTLSVGTEKTPGYLISHFYGQFLDTIFITEDDWKNTTNYIKRRVPEGICQGPVHIGPEGKPVEYWKEDITMPEHVTHLLLIGCMLNLPDARIRSSALEIVQSNVTPVAP